MNRLQTFQVKLKRVSNIYAPECREQLNKCRSCKNFRKDKSIFSPCKKKDSLFVNANEYEDYCKAREDRKVLSTYGRKQRKSVVDRVNAEIGTKRIHSKRDRTIRFDL